MSGRHEPMMDQDEPMLYQIRLKGHLDAQWSDWFDGATVTLEEDGNTLLTCRVIDQAALHGLLRRVRDLGMPLIMAKRIGPGRTDEPDVKP